MTAAYPSLQYPLQKLAIVLHRLSAIVPFSYFHPIITWQQALWLSIPFSPPQSNPTSQFESFGSPKPLTAWLSADFKRMHKNGW